MKPIVIALALALGAGAARAEPAEDVASLGWMAGSWVEVKDGMTTRATWLAPMDGVMSGAGQANRGGQMVSLELVKITAEPAGATFTAYLEGQPPTPFVLKPRRDGEWVFENLAHDFPQRVIYRRCGEQTCAAIEGMINGKLERQEWRYSRARP